MVIDRQDRQIVTVPWSAIGGTGMMQWLNRPGLPRSKSA